MTSATPSYLDQLASIDRSTSDPRQAAQQKGTLVGGWLKTEALPFFAELRDRQPIYQGPPFAIVTKYADVMEMFNSDDVFTTDVFAPQIMRDIGPFVLGMRNSAEYDRQKSILRLVFSRQDITRIQTLVKQETSRILGGIAPGQQFDLIKDYTRMVPALVIRRYLGLESIPHTTIWQWTRAIFGDIFANIAGDPAIAEAAVNAQADAAPIIAREIARRRRTIQRQGLGTPNVTVMDRLLACQQNETTYLSDDQIRDNLLGMFVGTLSLTNIAILSAYGVLAGRPDILPDAKSAAKLPDHSAVGGYVWEALRFKPPGTGLFRSCVRDYTLAAGTPRATTIKAGTIVYGATASAMHDADYIENPTEFQVGRPDDSYLFFFSGLHSCLGKYFSQIQVPISVQGLLNAGTIQFLGDMTLEAGFPDSWQVRLS
ncbi:MAG: cytochrome P450 [Cyanobacteria bacterium P01_A01_bin.3]